MLTYGQSKFAEGKREGEETAVRKTIKKMSSRGKSTEEIIDCVDAPAEKIRQWVEEIRSVISSA